MLDQRWRAFCRSGNLAIQNFQAMGTVAGLQLRLINTNVVTGHSRDREALFKTTAHTTSIQGVERFHLEERFVDTVDDIAGDPLVDHLWHRTMPKGKNRRATGHRLYHDKAERLRPVDGKEQARASPRNLPLARSSISPMYSMPGRLRRGRISISKYAWSTRSTFAAILSGRPTARAMSMARSTRFSGEIPPRNAI